MFKGTTFTSSPEPLLWGCYWTYVSERAPARSPPPCSITDDATGWQARTGQAKRESVKERVCGVHRPRRDSGNPKPGSFQEVHKHSERFRISTQNKLR